VRDINAAGVDATSAVFASDQFAVANAMTDWKWVLSHARKAYFAVSPESFAVSAAAEAWHHSAVWSCPPRSRPAVVPRGRSGAAVDWPSASARATASDLGLPAL